jgi:hypothetical protein
MYARKQTLLLCVLCGGNYTRCILDNFWKFQYMYFVHFATLAKMHANMYCTLYTALACIFYRIHFRLRPWVWTRFRIPSIIGRGSRLRIRNFPILKANILGGSHTWFYCKRWSIKIAFTDQRNNCVDICHTEQRACLSFLGKMYWIQS